MLVPMGNPPTRLPTFRTDKNKKDGKPVTKWPGPFWFPPNSAVTVEEDGGKGGGEDKTEEAESAIKFMFVLFE